MSVIDDRLAATAAAQHALITRAQVLACGGTDSVIRRRTNAGHWERVLPGVFALAGVPWTYRRRLCALVLGLDASARASHRAASKLLGVGGDGTPPYEITVAVDRAPRVTPRVPHPDEEERPVIIHESVDLHLDPTVLIDGIPTTAPRRLAVDLGSVVPFDIYRITVARLQERHGVGWLDLERTYRSHSIQGRNGCGALRDLLDLHHETEGTPDEVVEMLAADLIVGAGLPAPVHQFVVRRPDGKQARFDLAYPGWKIAIETEGRIHLREDVHQLDHQRRNQLLLAGWIVLHFTYADVTRRPLEVIRTIRAAIEERCSTMSGI